MDTKRIAQLLEPFLQQPPESSPLDQMQLDQISTYIDLLQRWNARVNLTAIRQEEEIVTRHFGESLFLARHVFPKRMQDQDGPSIGQSLDPRPTTTSSQPHVFDIGSGAGFPALPLKIWSPDIHLTLIESNHKKAAFLSEAARALGFANVNVITERAEVLVGRLGPQADVVTLRAVERFETVLPQAVSFLAPKGILAALITTAQTSHLTAMTSLKWRPQIHIPESETRVLSIGYVS